MGIYTAHGIILAHRDVRETDRLLTVFTREYGLMTLIAKGVRKSTSKLAGLLEPMTETIISNARGRRFDIVTASEVINSFVVIRSDSRRLALARYCLAVAATTVVERQVDYRMYALLSDTLSEFNKPAAQPRLGIAWYYLWHQLALLGYAPELYVCLQTKLPIAPGKNYFHLRRGGLVSIRAVSGEAIPISDNCIKLLRLLMRAAPDAVPRLAHDQSLRREMMVLSDAFFSYTQERTVPLMDFISTV